MMMRERDGSSFKSEVDGDVEIERVYGGEAKGGGGEVKGG